MLVPDAGLASSMRPGSPQILTLAHLSPLCRMHGPTLLSETFHDLLKPLYRDRALKMLSDAKAGAFWDCPG